MTKELKLFSFDAETNGLWGQAFSIAAIVRDNEQEVARFVGRCPIEESVNPWVAENILPAMEGIEITHSSYKELLTDFVQFWMNHKGTFEDPRVALVHMGHIVEAKLFRDAHKLSILGDWDAPYLWYDLCVLPEVQDSVDAYIKDRGIELDNEFVGGTHNPLYDSLVAAKVYEDWFKAEAEKAAEAENNKVELEKLRAQLEDKSSN